jgi:23S rRNA (uracil1939-C5)-methyltransferase
VLNVARPKPIGETIEVEVVAISERGEGVARPAAIGDRELRVPGLVPGDRARVRVEALARHRPLAHGRLVELLAPSPKRRELPCPRHRDQPERGSDCAGCPLMALPVEDQRAAKLERITREHGLKPTRAELIGGEEFSYRWSSKRVVAGRTGVLVFGSRAPRSRWVADMAGCLVDHPAIVASFAATQAMANELKIEAGDAEAGDLRYLWAKTDGERVLLTLITRGEAEHSRAARELGPRLAELELVTGVAHSQQAGAGNAIRGSAPTILAGASALELELAGHRFELGPLGFLQPNPKVAALAYRDLVADGSGALAIDLYAGAGVTTALLRERFTEVVACEAYPESAAALGVEPQTSDEFLAAWLGESRPRPELVVANPPRAGLGEQVCARLLELGAPRVHMMSCNPATAAADLERLAPAYELVELRAYDTLPQTPHLELVARLQAR